MAAGSSSETVAPPASIIAVSGALGAPSSSALLPGSVRPLPPQSQSPLVNTHIFNLLQAQIVALQPLLQSSHEASTHFAEHMTPSALAAAQVLSRQAVPIPQPQPEVLSGRQVVPLQPQAHARAQAQPPPPPPLPAVFERPPLLPDQSALQVSQTQALMQLYIQSIIMQQPQPLPLPPPPLEAHPLGGPPRWNTQPAVDANVPVTQPLSSSALSSAIPVNASLFPPVGVSTAASGEPNGGNGSSSALVPVPVPVPKVEAPPQIASAAPLAGEEKPPTR